MSIDNMKPIFKAPPLSCDTHLHVFGDPTTYPYSPNKRNVPPSVPLTEYMSQYRKLAESFGIERMVFTQPSTYGQDNNCMLDAIKLCGNMAKGIADIDEDISDKELDKLNSSGVVGIRFNLGPPNRPVESGLLEKHLPRLLKLDARCSEIGWQLDILSPSWLIIDMLNVYESLKSKFTLAHFGMFLAKDGGNQPNLLKMIDFLKNGPGNCYMKLTAPYRMASEPNFEDSAIIAKAFIEAVPDKIIWGSDYPYLSNSHRVNSINLFNLIPLWIPDKATQQKILVDNPAKLFGFTV